MTIGADRSVYRGEPIDLEAVLTYHAADGATIEVVGPSLPGPIGFGFEQLDGTLEMDPVSTADCKPYQLRAGDPLLQPHHLSQLPPGTYRIYAVATGSSDCGGDGIALEASIVIAVR